MSRNIVEAERCETSFAMGHERRFGGSRMLYGRWETLGIMLKIVVPDTVP
jgi:hypothetical protein